MLTKQRQDIQPIQLGEILTDTRTFAGSGKIVDKTTENWLIDVTAMRPETLGRSVRCYVSGLTDQEAGALVKQAFESIDPEKVGSFFKHCVQARLERR